MQKILTQPEELPASLEQITDEHYVKLLLTPRHGIVAPKGYSIVSLDFKNQEIYIATWLSQDPKFLTVFSEPETITVDGIEYKNPDADLHTLTAAYCCFPQLFSGQPKHLWREIADNPDLIKQKG